jgi:hypothetical protein
MSAREAVESLLWWSVPGADDEESKTRAARMLDHYRDEVAHELAEQQRLRMAELDLTGQKARIVGRIVDLIDPEVSDD